jgi:hypothetical protein
MRRFAGSKVHRGEAEAANRDGRPGSYNCYNRTPFVWRRTMEKRYGL